jgi:enterochelin esterase-like enzyme
MPTPTAALSAATAAPSTATADLPIIWPTATPNAAATAGALALAATVAASTPPPTPAVTPASPTPSPCAVPGRVEHGELPSAVAGGPMRYRIYLPPCYDLESRAYPTLYMFGGNIHDDGIWDALGLDEAAGRLIAAGDIPPLLIVMPDNGWLANTTTSGPNSYEGFVLNELLPYIEATYRAWPGREGRAVGGLSRGGYWSLMMAFRRPDLFRSVGAHSPALIDSHAGPGEDPASTGVINDLGDLRIWIDIGERDPYLTQARPLHEALTAAGVAHEWLVNPGTHDEAYWRANLDAYLTWYSDGWLDKGAP